MAVCDQLEKQLAATQVETRRLLEAVLFEALSTRLNDEGIVSMPIQGELANVSI